jgi:hypothetical protein
MSTGLEISIIDLWLPILVSAIAVFFISFLVHMVFTYHRNNIDPLPNEQQFADAMGPMDIAPGEYMVPFCNDPKEMESEAHKAKLGKGPVVMLTVFPNEAYNMGKKLGQWFISSLVVSLFTAYVASQAQLSLAAGGFMAIFQLTSVIAFLGYGLALIQDSIWYDRKWSTTMKFLFDALLYGLGTGLVFAYLWPELSLVA